MSSRQTNIPNTPVARRQRISELLASGEIRSQGQLSKLLASDGLIVTQATLSRDLDDIGAVKIRDSKGALIYAAPDSELQATGVHKGAQINNLARRLEQLLVSIESSGNTVVMHTPPGAAQLLASAFDHSGMEDILGTVAGDDTIFVVVRESVGGSQFVQRVIELAEGLKGADNA